MKWLLVITALIVLLISCHQVQSPEQPAIVVDYTLPGPTVFCACCAGYKIRIDSTYYYANTIPVAYAKPNTPVWIHYQADTDQCRGVAGRIEIISIRSR